jgi:AcrR family transcriptional regulator
MRDIAVAAGISRQALYLHFASKSELMVATMRYVDKAKGLDVRLRQLAEVADGIELLEQSVAVWGNYIPEIYGLAKAMLITRETDEAMAAAWDDSMRCLHDACRRVIETLHREAILVSQWSPEEAIEMLWTLLSVHNWEQLAVECGWSTTQYVDRMKIVLRRTFVKKRGIVE